MTGRPCSGTAPTGRATTVTRELFEQFSQRCRRPGRCVPTHSQLLKGMAMTIVENRSVHRHGRHRHPPRLPRRSRRRFERRCARRRNVRHHHRRLPAPRRVARRVRNHQPGRGRGHRLLRRRRRSTPHRQGHPSCRGRPTEPPSPTPRRQDRRHRRDRCGTSCVDRRRDRVPKSRTGNIEAIRVLTVARRSAANEWIAVVSQIRHVVFTAPDEIRARFLGLSPITLVRTTAALKPRRSDPDVVRFTTLSTLRELGRRALFLREQKMRLNTEMRPLIREVAPSLLESTASGSTSPRSC